VPGAPSIEDILDILCRAHDLSVRERMLVRLLVDGLDTPAIAGRLDISRYTVQDHLKSIFRKCGANSRLELLAGLLAQAR
jgi:DNA-binding CsgD family transcriptional regulator